MKKLFGGINLTWKKLIISAIIIGISVGLANSVSFLSNTSFTDPAVYFDLWILFGIIIIMNSKSNKDSALKCFIFFLISQPLIYLVEVPFSHMGWSLFGYYRYWFMWTILCLPMGYIGYYLKKNKWWGLLILLPMLLLVGSSTVTYLRFMIFSFPKHILSYLFCIACTIIYPLYVLGDKKAKIIGLVIGVILIISSTVYALTNRFVYETDVLINSDKIPIDKNYKVFLKDKEYGKLSISLIKGLEEYGVHAELIKEGKTEFVLEAPDKTKRIFTLKIKRDTYDVEEKISKK